MRTPTQRWHNSVTLSRLCPLSPSINREAKVGRRRQDHCRRKSSLLETCTRLTPSRSTHRSISREAQAGIFPTDPWASQCCKACKRGCIKDAHLCSEPGREVTQGKRKDIRDNGSGWMRAAGNHEALSRLRIDQAACQIIKIRIIWNYFLTKLEMSSAAFS